MIQRYFDLHGGWLAAGATDAVLLTQFAGILDQPGVEHAAVQACFHLEIRFGEPETPPDDGTLLHRGPVLDEGECVAVAIGGEMLQVFPGKASLRISDRQAVLTVAEGHARRAGMSLGMMALEGALRASGQVPIHAAGLTLPDGRMVIVFGRSGAGKTTTALALSGAGFGLARTTWWSRDAPAKAFWRGACHAA